MNKKDVFDSRIVRKIPAGKNAREKALQAEKANAIRLRNEGQLDARYHKTIENDTKVYNNVS